MGLAVQMSNAVNVHVTLSFTEEVNQKHTGFELRY